MRMLSRLVEIGKRHERTTAALVLLAILLICFSQMIWGHRTFLQSARSAPSILPYGAWAGDQPQPPKMTQVNDPGASAWASEPWFAVIGEQWKSATAPLWNEYLGYGQPLAANQQSQPFYPLTALLSLWLTPRTFSWYVALRLWVAGICGFAFLRYLVSFRAALAGAVACALAGYLVLHLNLPEVSVVALFPAALWAGEYLVRNPGYKAMVWFAVVILLVFLGGMPENAFLLFLFVYLYVAVRIISNGGTRALGGPQVRWLAAATITGLFLSAIVLVPFFEYVRRSSNFHEIQMTRGLEYDTISFAIFNYLLPLGFGPPGHIEELRNYCGVMAFYLMAVALLTSIRRTQSKDPLCAITWLSSATVLTIVLKRYGAPIVNEIGRLPVFRQISFPKYDEATLSFAVAILIAVGLERLIQKQAPALALWIPWSVVCALLPLCWLVAPRVTAVSESRPIPQMGPAAFALAATLLVALALCLWRKEYALIGVLVAAEFAGCYVIPAYDVFSRMPDRSANPYRGAPFVDFLKAHAGRDRIFGENQVLTPGWAGVFGLYDIRDLDALYIDRYFPFLRAFFPNENGLGMDLATVFRGWPDYQFAKPLERRLLQLSSVRYIANSKTMSHNRVVKEILSQNAGRLASGKEARVGLLQKNRVDDEFPETLMEHPPYERLPYRLQVPVGSEMFDYAYGLTPLVYEKAGDGVGFTLELQTPDGTIRKIFHNYVDPKHNVAERKWVRGKLDLHEFTGQSVTLLFSTDPGPKGDTNYDWAGWTDLGFEGESREKPLFKGVYGGADAIVLQYDDVLPRAAIFYRADVADDNKAVLKRLADADWNPFQSVIVNRAELGDERRALEALRLAPAHRVDAARIVRYRSQNVAIQAKLARDGILMLNDSGFPGWEVKIDGRAASWFPADYLFRGVALKAGEHTVEFLYKPKSFLLGSLLSGMTGLGLIGGGCWKRFARFSKKEV